MELNGLIVTANRLRLLTYFLIVLCLNCRIFGPPKNFGMAPLCFRETVPSGRTSKMGNALRPYTCCNGNHTSACRSTGDRCQTPPKRQTEKKTSGHVFVSWVEFDINCNSACSVRQFSSSGTEAGREVFAANPYRADDFTSAGRSVPTTPTCACWWSPSSREIVVRRSAGTGDSYCSTGRS